MSKRPPAQLERLSIAILEGAGALPAHAATVARHLVESNLVGHDSHGVMRLSQYCSAIDKGELDPRARPVVLHDNPAGAVLDGKSAFGQVAAAEGMALAIEKARKASVAAVTLRNCYHSGRLAVYSQMAASANMIGIVLVNAGGGGQSVAPFGGIDRRLATNPFSIAAPSGGDFDPVLDVATSMAPEGKVRDYHRRGALLPDGWIVDAAGKPVNDSKYFYGSPPGALLPWGGSIGHKGFGLALMIDIMAGALSGAGCCGPELLPARDGILLIALNIEQFGSLDYFRDQVAQLIEYVKSSRPAPGIAEVFAPGELEHREFQERKRTGVNVDDTTWQEIIILATRYGIDCKLLENGDEHINLPHVSMIQRRSGDFAAS